MAAFSEWPTYTLGAARAAALFRDLNLSRADGSLRILLRRMARIDVLVIDDWAMAPISEAERRDLWEICENRYRTRSMILISQLPVSKWHEQIGDPGRWPMASSIRIVHNGHRIEMRGDSMRKTRGNKPEPAGSTSWRASDITPKALSRAIPG